MSSTTFTTNASTDGVSCALSTDHIKQSLADFDSHQAQAFAHTSTHSLLIERSDFMDILLIQLWQGYALHTESMIALLAVGGYGRGELHPYSDIDLLILSPDSLTQQQEEKMGQFLAKLWDLHLIVGHSARTFKECLTEAKHDLTIYTNLLESRYLTGNQDVFSALHTAVFSDQLWTTRAFYEAKIAEQQARHLRYHGTSYNLEPDLKNSPGGLRDIHILQWIALRFFGAKSISEMLATGYITEDELNALSDCRELLWRMRFALHLVISRQDNRLLFDRQLSVAQLLKYSGDKNVPIERMMKDYYRAVHNVSELNTLLLQVIAENQSSDATTQTIDADFSVRNRRIDVKNPLIFQQAPEKIINLFLSLAKHPAIDGIHSHTLRKLRLARQTLTSPLCDIPDARHVFMQILRHPNAIRRALLPMHKHGILSAYLAEWQHIAGMMQFNLFHSYTVDEHTIRVLLEIAKMVDRAPDSPYPLCQTLYPALPKPEILLIAALFHDIGKGQSGDHSLIGAKSVAEFAHRHALDEHDTHDIVWLVKYHLLMSLTAQGQDIQDITVIHHFAKKVRKQHRLSYLLCLTVADMSATNDTLWNGWRQSLLNTLYYATTHLFEQGLVPLPDKRIIAREHRQTALKQLSDLDIDSQRVKSHWRRCRLDYFYRHTPTQLAWHMTCLLSAEKTPSQVFIHTKAQHQGTEIFIYTPDRAYLFATVCRIFDLRNLTIQSAHIFTNKDNIAMDTFIVLEPSGKPLSEYRQNVVKHALNSALQKAYSSPQKARKLPAKLKHFHVPTQVNFLPPDTHHKTCIEVIALDRPGLLARIAEAFASLNLSLHSAQITTIGERVEDLFILSDSDGKPLNDILCAELNNRLIKTIDSMNKIG